MRSQLNYSRDVQQNLSGDSQVSHRRRNMALPSSAWFSHTNRMVFAYTPMAILRIGYQLIIDKILFLMCQSRSSQDLLKDSSVEGKDLQRDSWARGRIPGNP